MTRLGRLRVEAVTTDPTAIVFAMRLRVAGGRHQTPSENGDAKRSGGLRTRGSLAKRQGAAKWSWGEHHWHRHEVNPYPPGQDLFERDLPRLIREYATVGHTPAEPLLEADDPIITIGSCFARELHHLLKSGGFRTGWLDVPSGLNNTYALLDFVSWCITGEELGSGFRYDRLDSGEIREWKHWHV